MNETEKLVDLYYGSLQAVRRAQKYYLAILLAFLAFVWLGQMGAGKPRAAISVDTDTVSVPKSAPVAGKNLLEAAPAITTILLLGLVGCLRATEPALKRFQGAWASAGGKPEAVGLAAIDTHRSWVDYMTFIWPQRYAFIVHAAVLVAALVSTLSVGLILVPEFKGYGAFLFASYCLAALVLQCLAAGKWIFEGVSFTQPGKGAAGAAQS